jgi:hypothetical protein
LLELNIVKNYSSRELFLSEGYNYLNKTVFGIWAVLGYQMPIIYPVKNKPFARIAIDNSNGANNYDCSFYYADDQPSKIYATRLISSMQLRFSVNLIFSFKNSFWSYNAEYSNTNIPKIYRSPDFYNLSVSLSSNNLYTYITYMNISNVLAYINTSSTSTTSTSTSTTTTTTTIATTTIPLVTTNNEQFPFAVSTTNIIQNDITYDQNRSSTTNSQNTLDSGNFYSTATISSNANKSEIVDIIKLNYSELIEILSSNAYGLNGCLMNCSNKGDCYRIDNFYKCICNDYFTGESCDTDTRACSSNPCLNNGICVDIQNKSKSLTNWEYKCNCTIGIFGGENCQNEINLCLINKECNKNGYCVNDNGQAKCKCFMSYFGDKCENTLSELVIQKGIVKTAVIIAILMIIAFYLVIFIDDLLRYYICKMKFKKVKKDIKKKTKRVKKRQPKSFFYDI